MPNEQQKAPRPIPEVVALTKTAPDEYLWFVQQRRIWGRMTLLILGAFVIACAAVVYIGGRQAFVFSRYGLPASDQLNSYFLKYRDTGITLANSALSVQSGWASQLMTGLYRCWQYQPCDDRMRADVQDWRAHMGVWFPELAWAIKILQLTAGGMLLSLLAYLTALVRVRDWYRWEAKRIVAAGGPERKRQLGRH